MFNCTYYIDIVLFLIYVINNNILFFFTLVELPGLLEKKS